MNTMPLARIRSGHDHPTIALNIRCYGRDQIAQTVATIRAKGVISPLILWADPDDPGGDPYALDGNRRLDSLRALLAAGEIGEDYPVPFEMVEGPLVDLIETAIILNTDRKGLHPIDEFEAFMRLRLGGKEVAEIAETHGITVKEVNQRLALGNLATDVRDAWRAGSITAEQAQWFTLAQDHKAQSKGLAWFLKQPEWNRHKHSLVEQLLGTSRDRGDELKFVGRAAFKKAGGVIATDLFGERSYVVTPEILDQMVAARFAAEIERIKAEGWSWVTGPETQVDRIWDWPKLSPEPVLTDEQRTRIAELEEAKKDPRKWHAANQEILDIEAAGKRLAVTPEMMAVAGVRIKMDHDGRLEEVWGYIDPSRVTPEQLNGIPIRGKHPNAPADDGESTPSAAGSVKGEPPRSDEPASVVDRLRDEQTMALSNLIAARPTRALNLLVAALFSRAHSGSPIHFRMSGHYEAEKALKAKYPDQWGGDFVDNLAWVSGVDDIDQLVADLVAGAVNTSTRARRTDVHDGKGVRDSGVDAAFAHVADPDVAADQLRQVWQVEPYFAGVRKDQAVRAISEATQDEALVKKAGGMKKGDLTAFAAQVVPPTGWLPAELRVPGYQLPAPPPAAEAAEDGPAGEESAAGDLDTTDASTPTSPTEPPSETVSTEQVKLTRAQRENLLVLLEHRAVDHGSGVGAIKESRLNPQTQGSLATLGLTAKGQAKKASGQRGAVYWLTQDGGKVAANLKATGKG